MRRSWSARCWSRSLSFMALLLSSLLYYQQWTLTIGDYPHLRAQQLRIIVFTLCWCFLEYFWNSSLLDAPFFVTFWHELQGTSVLYSPLLYLCCIQFIQNNFLPRWYCSWCFCPFLNWSLDPYGDYEDMHWGRLRSSSSCPRPNCWNDCFPWIFQCSNGK